MRSFDPASLEPGGSFMKAFVAFFPFNQALQRNIGPERPIYISRATLIAVPADMLGHWQNQVRLFPQSLLTSVVA
jgi:hypothetical protein